MTIDVKPATDWDNINLAYLSPKYPSWNNPNIPKNYSVYLVCGSRTSGKTYNTCQLIKQMERSGAVHNGKRIGVRTIVISPTAEANNVFLSLDSLDPDDIHLQYSDEVIRDMIEQIKEQRLLAEQYEEDVALYNRLKKAKSLQDLDAFDIGELMKASQWGFQEPQPPAVYPLPVINLVLDDLVGSEALRNGRSPVINLILRNRHLGLNVFILSQTIKNVPKAIRTNANVFMIFRYANADMVRGDFYEEVSNLVKEDEFGDLYEFATTADDEDSHPFLLVDWTKPRSEVFRKAFRRYIAIQK